VSRRQQIARAIAIVFVAVWVGLYVWYYYGP
jgi:hypothetical protein